MSALLALVALLLFVTLLPSARAITISANLEPATLRVGEVATLTVTCNGGRPQRAPQLRAVPGLQFAYAGETSQVTLVNGNFSQTFNYSFQVQPQKEGRYDIPGALVDIGGQVITTSQFTLTVLAANSRAPEANPFAKYAFLRVSVSKTNVFLGEIFSVETKLYFQSLANPNLNIPQSVGEGFRFTLLRPVVEPKGREQYGQNVYNVYAFRTGALATRPGIVPLAFETELTLLLNRGGIFGERHQVKLTNDPVAINVAPLPTNAPASFNGAVGSFNLTMQASPTTLTVGDPLTIRMQITGLGELDAVQLPPLAAWREFKTYPPTSKVEPSDQLGMQGVKNFEIVALPENAEVKELAPLEFTFFDPAQRAYRTIYSPRIPVTVRAATVTAQQPTIVTLATNDATTAAPAPPPPAQDIVHIKSRPGTLAQLRPPLVEQPVFLALQSVPLLAWLALLVRRRRAENLANNPRRQRTIQTERLLKSGLHEARRLAEQNKTQEFFATIFRLLQEQIGERLDQPATAITEEIIETGLRPLGASDALLKSVHELFQTCNRARYAPQGTRETLAALVPKVATALGELQKLRAA